MSSSSYAFIKAALFEEAQHQDFLRNLTLKIVSEITFFLSYLLQNTFSAYIILHLLYHE